MAPRKRVAPDCDSSKLHQQDLHDESEDDDAKEDPVVEEVGEDIQVLAQLAAIDLIEYLHHHEGLEHDRIQDGLVDLSLKLGSVANLTVLRDEFGVVVVWKVEQLLTSKQDD